MFNIVKIVFSCWENSYTKSWQRKYLQNVIRLFVVLL